METLLIYIVQSALVLSLLFIPFQLLLRKESNVRLNRMLLVGTLLASLLLPLIEYHMPASWFEHFAQQAADEPTEAQIALYLIGSSLDEAETPSWISLHWMELIAALWLSGMIAYIIWQSIGLIRIYRIMHSSDVIRERLDNGVKLYLCATPIPSFSWMNSIVMSADDYGENGATIICHEQAHIAGHHSIDKLLFMAVQAIQWFNPFVWLMGDALCQVHEYEADRSVINHGIDARKYQLLLICKAAGPAGLAMVNGFKHNKLKSRIFMMNNHNHSRYAWARYLALAPMCLIAFFVSACMTPKENNENANSSTQANSEEQAPGKSIEMESPVDPEDVFFEVVEDMPEFPGGNNEALVKFISDNLKYPTKCIEEGIEGRVIMSFIVEKDGSVGDIKEMKEGEAHPLLVEAASRVIAIMPKWKPGKQRGQEVRVHFVMPINFKIPKEAK